MTVSGLKELKFSTKVQIARPLPEVYRTVVEPERLCQFFTATATPMEVGQVSAWTFPDGMKSNVLIKELDMNRKVVFEWDAHKVDYKTSVTVTFDRGTDGRTVVHVTEKGWKPDAEGVTSSYEHRGGWEHMLLCLKAFLEHKVDLRK